MVMTLMNLVTVLVVAIGLDEVHAASQELIKFD
jgi:hypothetical protein